MKLYIVRHGETDYNTKKIIQGQVNTPLNKKGEKQAKLIAKRLGVVNFDLIYSSDLRRAKQTTKEIMKFQKCLVKYVKELRERHYGIFQNKFEQIYYEYLAQNNVSSHNPDYRIPGGESRQDHYIRVEKFLEKIYKKHKDKTVLLSTHGGTKKAILRYLINIPRNQYGIKDPDNASLTIVQFHENGKHKIELEGDVKHLKNLKQ
ncbi:MAG: histidine phosphatase family protein [Patescibacteria group bacterium]|jgi:broad specificity phosphatase PhoE